MNYVFAAIGLYVQIVFLYKRSWLFEKKPFLILVYVNTGLFILAYLLMHLSVGDENLIRMLTVPLLSTTIFFIIRTVHFAMYKRDFEDTLWSMDLSQLHDGIVNALFWILGSAGAILIAYFVLP